MNSKQQTSINSGTRSLVCGSLATIITAALSWSFVVSADSLQWMGSGNLDPPAVAALSGGLFRVADRT